MMRKPRAPAMSKEAMRQESERLVREAMARNVTITHGKTLAWARGGRGVTWCSKCGAPNRVTAEVGQSRVEYACREQFVCALDGESTAAPSIIRYRIGRRIL